MAKKPPTLIGGKPNLGNGAGGDKPGVGKWVPGHFGNPVPGSSSNPPGVGVAPWVPGGFGSPGSKPPPRPGPGGGGNPPPKPPPPPPPPQPPPPAPPPDAYYQLKQLFDSYDLGTLAPKILDFLQKGYSATAVTSMLQETDEYKQRFAGNVARQKAGLRVLSPAEYLATEAGYRQVLQSYGLPKGFYDQHSDFIDWIGKDVSVNEINDRAKMAEEAVNNSDPAYIQALNQMGLGSGDLIAKMLDTNRALPLLQRSVNAAKIGQQALDQGLTFNSQKATQWADLGITADQARQNYGTIAGALPTAGSLSQIYGQQFGQTDLESELFNNSGLASQRRKALANLEAGSFAGSSGGTKQAAQETRAQY